MHPATLVAIALLLLNDHYFKQHFADTLTGKLSDFTGLFFSPLLLSAFLEVVEQAFGRRVKRRTIALLVTLFVGLGFGAVKLSRHCASIYGTSVGYVRWLLLLPINFIERLQLGHPKTVIIVHDPMDLYALMSLPIAYFLIVRYSRSGS